MFIPHTDQEKEAMLSSIGVKRLEDLFKCIPEKHRFPKLELPDGLTEMEVLDELKDFSTANETAGDMVSFLGAGAYRHYIPAAVDALISRGEFFSAYTPYQPEISQGTLQAIFEFQTLVANLTGMELSNASHYDGATAAAEAGVMAYHNFRGKRTKIMLSPAVNPQYKQVMCSYLCDYENVELITVGKDLFENPEILSEAIDVNTALVVVQYPDFFGHIHDFTKLASKTHENGALLAVIANPTALGMLKTPGAMGADIVVGEGQPLGIPLSFGGPYLGFLATRNELVRKISGRLVGETVDNQGRRGYVLTLTAREQHIRREKATSNICTNQGLMALAATIYMSLLGKSGMQQVANLCYQKAHYAAEVIGRLPKFKVLSAQPFFHEFVVKCPTDVEHLNHHLLEAGFMGGYNLGSLDPKLKDHMLVAVTEVITREEIDDFASALKEAAND
jgi:glycine dehydrogenase subunit 1